MEIFCIVRFYLAQTLHKNGKSYDNRNVAGKKLSKVF